MNIRARLLQGWVIPAHPLALTAGRKLDERRQRALTRYYVDAGAGGIAVGVHTTQFAIRDAGLYEPVLELARDEVKGKGLITVAGTVGQTPQAVREAQLAAKLGYDTVLLSLGALKDASIDQLVEHVRAVADVLPVFGFYLQPAVGGRPLPYEFWRRFSAIDNVVAIKIAAFDRYQTLDVLRGVADSGRGHEIALYTGNDDNIVVDLLTEFRYRGAKLRFAGGLLGHWAFWTHRSVQMLERVRGSLVPDLLTLACHITDANGAIFDVANGFHGCIPGIHEVLRRQGLLAGRWCLDTREELSPGQLEEIDRVCDAYPHLNDDPFVHQNRDRWLR